VLRQLVCKIYCTVCLKNKSYFFKEKKDNSGLCSCTQPIFTKVSAQSLMSKIGERAHSMTQNRRKSNVMGTLFDPLLAYLQRLIDLKVGAGESVLWTQQQTERGFTGCLTNITVLY
jgi:hypothetical protein